MEDVDVAGIAWRVDVERRAARNIALRCAASRRRISD
jgi:hypothetical protein